MIFSIYESAYSQRMDNCIYNSILVHLEQKNNKTLDWLIAKSLHTLRNFLKLYKYSICICVFMCHGKQFLLETHFQKKP